MPHPITRRTFCLMATATAASGLAGCQTFGGPTLLGYVPVPQLGHPEDEPYPLPPVPMDEIPVQYRRQLVDFAGKEKPGTIIVDTADRYLFLVQPHHKAIRYGIGVGRQGFSWSGTATIQHKEKWPGWTPPPEMVARDPRAAQFADGMPPGPYNPLGARAMYLYQNGHDTLYRIHGSPEWQSIGHAVSSGCIRLLNRDVIDLYERVPLGTKVIVEQGGLTA